MEEESPDSEDKEIYGDVELDPSRSSKKMKGATILEGKSFKEAFEGPRAEDSARSVDEEVRLEDDIVVTQVDGIDCVDFSLAFKEKLYRRCGKAVIVKLLGRNVSVPVLDSRLRVMWRVIGDLELVDLGEGFVMVKFSCEDDRRLAMGGGPWMLFGHYLTVRKWVPGFDPLTAEIGDTAIWIRFPRLPFEFYDGEILEILGNCVGKVVKFDPQTQLAARAKFARVCVEVDLKAPLKSVIRVAGKDQAVQYEGLGWICFKCGRVGHRDPCPFRVDGDVGKEKMHAEMQVDESGVADSVKDKEATKSEKTTEKFGPWLRAEPRRPRREQAKTYKL